MKIQTHNGEVEIHGKPTKKTQQIIQETIPIIQNPKDIQKLRNTAHQLLSQKDLAKEKTNEKHKETIDEYTTKTFTKGYRLGKLIEEDKFKELHEAIDLNIDWEQANEKGMTQKQSEKFTYAVLGRIAYEAGLIYGVFNKVYNDSGKIERYRQGNPTAYH